MELVIFLGEIGVWSYVLIAAAILLLFGGQKIPELMKGLGSGIKEFKDATKDEQSSKSDDQNSAPASAGTEDSKK